MTDFLTINTLLYLRHLRATYLVGQALAQKYPTEGAWDALLDDVDFREEVTSFSGVMQDIIAAAKTGEALDLERMQVIGGQHVDRAMEALYLTAERLDLDPADLLTALIRA